MLRTKVIRRINLQRSIHLALVSLVVVGVLMPLMLARDTSAAQMTSRSLLLSTAVIGSAPGGNAVQYTFTFTIPSILDVEGLKIEFCTTAVGSCVGPTGLTTANRTFGTQSGWQGATNFAVSTSNTNDCNGTLTRIICANRTDATAQTATSRSIRFDAMTNPTTANSTLFARITTYDNSSFSISGGAGNQAVDTGTVASAVTQTLTVSAYVAEVLNFCVGATAVDDATTSVGASCSNVTGTTVDIGVLEDGLTNVSPVDASPYNGNDFNGVAMIRTNAINGATASYRAIQQSGTEQLGTLRIAGQTCSATTTDATDPCIEAAGITALTFNAGTDTGDLFGMTIAAINCGSTTSYGATTCFADNTYHLRRNAEYDGTGGNTYPTDTTSQVSGNTNAQYAWRQDGVSSEIASSTAESSKVIDDEAMILKLAAYSAITTPFGTYTAQADFIALATY